MQSLCDLKTDDAVRERIGRLPPKLEDLYMELYEKFTNYQAEADRKITRSALSWLLCAQRTMSSSEFLAMLSMTPRGDFSQPSVDQVLDMCCNMVVFDATLDTFRFAHLSVREFLEKQPDYKKTLTNSLAAETCLLKLIYTSHNPAAKRFLSQQKQSLETKSTFLNNFGTYPTIYWATHCQLAADQRTKGVLKDFFSFFLANEFESGSAFTLWTGSLENLLGYNNDFRLNIDYRLREKLQDIRAVCATAVFLACSFDFAEVITDQLAKGIFLADYINKTGLAALHVAVKHGSCGVISVLITNKLTEITEKVVEAAAGIEDSGTEVMRLLLDRRGDDVKITEKVVEAAAGNANNGKEVMTLLLDRRGDDVKITEKVVEAVAGNEDSGKEVMILLLRFWSSRNTEKERHINLADTDHKAILYAAVLLGHEALVKLLISSSLDINGILGGDSTALNLAICEGHHSVAQMLLNQGADLMIKDSHGWTPYTAALMSGRDSMSQLLLEYSYKAVDFGKSTGFIPNRLIKPIAASKVLISEDGYTAVTGLSLS